MNENELIAKAQAGDPNAFNELFGKYQQFIYSVCLQYLKNPEDAWDCLQDCMLRIYRSFGSFKGNSSVSTWIYRVARNICLDELRKRKRSKETSIEPLIEQGRMPAEEHAIGPEGRLVHKERARALSALIDQLPEDSREFIVLRDLRNFSYEEIAEITNTNIGTVKSRISRTRERLRKMILKNRELYDGLLV